MGIDIGIRLPEIGRIKIGNWRIMTKDGVRKKIPNKLGHFVITTLDQDADGNWVPDVQTTKQLAYKGENPDAPKVVGPFVLPYDRAAENCYTTFAWYTKSKAQCIGDGNRCRRRKDDGTVIDSICDPDTCPDLNGKEKRCRPALVLGLIPRDGVGFGGVYIFRSHSWNTVRAIQSQLALFAGQTMRFCGREALSGIPFHLCLRHRRTSDRDGVMREIQFVTLDFLDGGYMQFVQRLAEMGKLISPVQPALAPPKNNLLERAAEIMAKPEEYAPQPEDDEEGWIGQAPDTGQTETPAPIAEPRDGSEGILLHKNTPAAKAAAAAELKPTPPPAVAGGTTSAPAQVLVATMPGATVTQATTTVTAPAKPAAPAIPPSEDSHEPLNADIEKTNPMLVITPALMADLCTSLNVHIKRRGRAAVDKDLQKYNVTLGTLYGITDDNARALVIALAPKKRQPKVAEHPTQATVAPVKAAEAPKPAPVAAPAPKPAPEAVKPAVDRESEALAYVRGSDERLMRQELIAAISAHGTVAAMKASPGRLVNGEAGLKMIQISAAKLALPMIAGLADLETYDNAQLMKLEGSMNSEPLAKTIEPKPQDAEAELFGDKF